PPNPHPLSLHDALPIWRSPAPRSTATPPIPTHIPTHRAAAAPNAQNPAQAIASLSSALVNDFPVTRGRRRGATVPSPPGSQAARSEEHTSELQSLAYLV